MTTQSPLVLVTGATGRLGRLLVPRLQAQGARVRVYTRQPGQARLLLGPQVEIATGDLDDPAALRRASQGATHAFLLSPITPTLAVQQIAVVEAARAEGVGHIVKLSGSDWTIAPAGRSLSGDAHALVEAALLRAGLSHVVLRPNAWSQVVLGRIAQELQVSDVITSPHGDARVSYIDARDIADVAVEALLNQALVQARRAECPGPWVLTGSEALDYPAIATLATRITGRPVRCCARGAMDLGQRLPAEGMPTFIQQVHAQFAALINAGEAESITDTVEQVLGRAQLKVDDYLGTALA